MHVFSSFKFDSYHMFNINLNQWNFIMIKQGLNNLFKSGVSLLVVLVLTVNASAQENIGEWLQEEKNAFLSSCLYNSQDQGLDDFTAGVYCNCTLKETIKLYPNGAPQLEEWDQDELYSIINNCMEFTHNDKDVIKSGAFNESFGSVIDYLIQQNEYEKALILIDNGDRSDPEINLLLEKTHLNFGLYYMSANVADDMRLSMNNALIQFTEVLRINPQNAVAREQIEQIMSIYNTIPGRLPEESTLRGLREIGFNY